MDLGIFLAAILGIMALWGDFNFADFLFWILGIITEIRFECRDAWSNRWSSI